MAEVVPVEEEMHKAGAGLWCCGDSEEYSAWWDASETSTVEQWCSHKEP